MKYDEWLLENKREVQERGEGRGESVQRQGIILSALRQYRGLGAWGYEAENRSIFREYLFQQVQGDLVRRACMLSHFNRVQLFATLWAVACQFILSMGFPRQEYQSGLPCPSPGDLPNPGKEPTSSASLTLQADCLLLSHRGSPIQ